MIIAIDGPAGSGKGTVAKILADNLNFTKIDTGAMYRCIALKLLEENIKLDEIFKIQNVLDNIKIDLKNDNVYLNDEDVSKKIRTNEVSNYASPVSTIEIIRTKMVELQRKFADEKNVVMEGRDIGTVVFPNAEVKIYLDATPEERAKRRVKQNELNGINSDYEQILKDIIERDERDMSREISPLKKAEDAIVVDSTNLTISEVVEKIEKIVKEK